MFWLPAEPVSSVHISWKNSFRMALPCGFWTTFLPVDLKTCVLKRLNPADPASIQGQLEILEGDLRDAEIVKAAMRGIDLVFHLAAFVSVSQSMTDPQNCFDVNVGGTVALLEAARQEGVRKVVLSSSTAVYGDTDKFPTDEGTPLSPLSPYALSKQINELYARLYTRTFHLPVIALRYFNVYGPRQRPDSDYAAAIPIFVRHLVSRGTHYNFRRRQTKPRFHLRKRCSPRQPSGGQIECCR